MKQFDSYADLPKDIAAALGTIEGFITNAEEEGDPDIQAEIGGFNLIVEILRKGVGAAQSLTNPDDWQDALDAWALKSLPSESSACLQSWSDYIGAFIVSRITESTAPSDQDIQSRLTHHALVRLFKACKTQTDLQASLDHAESVLRGDWKNTAQPSPSVAVNDRGAS
ncbi:hypothetical protein [Tardiphaga sp. 841_E9_N1_2]|uniref:hypothetical protein n=1 Tax=Tardiphaga sp. 841_E9_N1_2 TaxID=3240762 RepID=UPI003F29C1F8